MESRPKTPIQPYPELRTVRQKQLAELFPKVRNFRALINCDPTSPYISRGFQSYRIKQTEQGFWIIERYRGGLMDKRLRTSFTRFIDAENELINYLKRTDKFNKARYPGCQEH